MAPLKEAGTPMELDHKLAQLIEEGEELSGKGVYSVFSLENLSTNRHEWESEIREACKAYPEIEAVKNILDEATNESLFPAGDLQSYIKAEKTYIERVLDFLRQFTN
jgi:hypothetical protein